MSSLKFTGTWRGHMLFTLALSLLFSISAFGAEPELTDQERDQDAITSHNKNAVSCTTTGNVIFCDGLFSDLITFSINSTGGGLHYFVKTDFKNAMISHSCTNTTYFLADSDTDAHFVNAFYVAEAAGKTVRIKLYRNTTTGDCNLNQFRIFY